MSNPEGNTAESERGEQVPWPPLCPAGWGTWGEAGGVLQRKEARQCPPFGMSQPLLPLNPNLKALPFF